MGDRLTVNLDYSERLALESIASQELRPVPFTLKWLIRQEAVRRGIWDDIVAKFANTKDEDAHAP